MIEQQQSIQHPFSNLNKSADTNITQEDLACFLLQEYPRLLKPQVFDRSTIRVRLLFPKGSPGFCLQRSHIPEICALRGVLLVPSAQSLFWTSVASFNGRLGSSKPTADAQQATYCIKSRGLHAPAKNRLVIPTRPLLQLPAAYSLFASVADTKPHVQIRRRKSSQMRLSAELMIQMRFGETSDPLANEKLELGSMVEPHSV